MTARAESFRNPYRIPTASDPSSVYVIDINGDGVLDIIYGDFFTKPARMHTLLGQASGAYLPGPVLTLPASVEPYCRILDANNDGKIDLVCPYASTFDASILTFLGNGDGTFGVPITTPLPTSNENYLDPVIFGPMHLTSSGHADVMVYDLLNGTIYALLGDGTGGFKVVPTTGLNGEPFAADVNGDGKTDLIYPGGSVFYGNGDGTFYSKQGNALTGYCVYHDMDGDGHIDGICGLGEATDGDITGGTQLLIYHGNSDGTFNPNPIQTITYGDHSNEFNGYGAFLNPHTVLDLNGDGIPDVLADAGDGLTVILGKSNLGFQYPVHYAAGYFSVNNSEFAGLFASQFVDMNGDGLPDVVTAGPNGIYISYAQKDGSLATATAFEATQVIGYETVADFNEDGVPDVAATGDKNIELSIGNGDGTFKPRDPLPNGDADFSTPLSATNALMAHGDFNGDGHQDIIAIGSSSIYEYDYYLLNGNGDGTFSTPTRVPNTSYIYPTGAYSQVFDFNHDGRDDLISTDLGDLKVALSNGDGTFKFVTTTIPVEPSSQSGTDQTYPALADFNGDGKLDVIIGTGAHVYLLKGHGDGSFDSTGFSVPIPAYLGVASWGSIAVAAGDFDGDGHQDIALLSASGISLVPPTNTIASVAFVYFGKGDGTFEAGVPIAAFNRYYTGMAAGDLNRDGKSDLIFKTSGTLGGGIAVGVVDSLPNRNFSPEVNYYAGSGLADISIADLNRDGFPDLLFSNGDYNIRASSVTVLMNLGNTPAVIGTLVAQPEPSIAGQAFQLIATLTPPSPATLTGKVEFSIDGSPVGSSALAGNKATFAAPSNLTVGTHAISATWPGDTTYPEVIFSSTHEVILAPTTTRIVSSSNPASASTNITFTATTTSAYGTPGGEMTFADGVTTLGTVALVNGSAMYSTAALATGRHIITATYMPTGNFSGSSASLVEVINGIPSNTSLAAAPNPAYATQTVSLSAQVRATDATPANAGTVTFLDGSTSLGSSPVNVNGVATLDVSFASGLTNPHALTAAYSGDSKLDSSTSAPVNEIILLNPSATAIISIAPNPGLAFQTSTVTVKVSSTTGRTILPTGSVDIHTTGVSFGDFPIVNGVATGTVGRDAGTYPITATYSGDSIFAVSSSQPVNFVVQPQPSSVSLTSSLNPAAVGSSVTFKAAVHAFGSPITGTVTFLDGSNPLGSPVQISGSTSVATYTTSALAVGTHAITAVYSGAQDFAGSTSAVLNQQIVPYVGDFSITASPTTASFYTGESATFHVTVNATGGFDQPLGLACSGLPANSTCSFTPSSLSSGQGESTLIIQTAAPHKTSAIKAQNSSPLNPGTATMILGAWMVVLFPSKSRRRIGEKLLLLLLISIAEFTSVGCSNVTPISGGTPPGTYHISVTAQTTDSGSSLTHATEVTVTVKSLF